MRGRLEFFKRTYLLRKFYDTAAHTQCLWYDFSQFKCVHVIAKLHARSILRLWKLNIQYSLQEHIKKNYETIFGGGVWEVCKSLIEFRGLYLTRTTLLHRTKNTKKRVKWQPRSNASTAHEYFWKIIFDWFVCCMWYWCC